MVVGEKKLEANCWLSIARQVNSKKSSSLEGIAIIIIIKCTGCQVTRKS